MRDLNIDIIKVTIVHHMIEFMHYIGTCAHMMLKLPLSLTVLFFSLSMLFTLVFNLEKKFGNYWY